MTNLSTTIVSGDWQALPAVEAQPEISPFILEFFMVQGANFRCMAYRDEDGKWRDALNNEELYGDIRILE
jgi:hypothetical protein